MEVGLWVAVLLCETKVNDVDLVTTLANAHQEVVGLDVAVDERFCVDVLDAGDELVGQQKNGLQREFTVAEVEKIFQTGSKQIENHSVVITLGTEPAYEWDPNTTSEGLVDTGLIFELWVLGLHRLKLDSNLFSRDDVRS